MNTKIISIFSSIFLVSILGIAGLTWLSLKKKNHSVADTSKNYVASTLTASVQMIEVHGDAFLNNEPVRGETIYLCNNAIYNQANSEYRENLDKDMKSSDNSGFPLTYWTIATLTLKNSQACTIKTQTDVNGHFHFQSVEKDKFFVATSYNIKGQHRGWIVPINEANYNKISLR